MIKKFICIVISVILVMSFVSGCSGNGDQKDPDKEVVNSTDEPTTGSSDNAEPVPEEIVKNPVEISIAWDGIQGIADDDIGKYIQDKFKMNIIPVAADPEQLNLMAVSDTLPDIFVSDIGTPAFNNFVREEFVRDIPQALMDKYPAVKSLAENHEVGALHKEMTGKIYGVPRPTNLNIDKTAMESAIYYREDWRVELGIPKVPETIDEFYNMLKAFSTKEGVYGTSGWVWQAHLIPWVDYSNWILEDGIWIPGYTSKDMVPALEFFNKLYKEKILDPEFTVSPIKDMFYQGKIGAMVGNASTYWLFSNLMVGFRGANPDLDAMEAVKLLPPIQGLDGNPRWVKIIANSIIMINSKTDDEKVDRFLELLEWMISDEGRDMRDYGFLDVDYVLKDGKAVSILPYKSGEYGRQQPIWEKYPSMGIFNLLSWESVPATLPLNPILPQAITDLNKVFQETTHGPAAVDVNIIVNNIQTPAKDISTIGVVEAETEFNRIISTDNPAEEFQIIKKKWLEIDGLQQVIDEVNQAVKDQGIK